MGHSGSSRPLPLFDVPVRPARLRLIPSSRSRDVSAGQVLIREGEASNALHLVESGAVSISAAVASGHRVILAFLSPGAVFGQEGLLPEAIPEPQRVCPEVRALVASRILSVPLSHMSRALSSEPELARWLAGSLARGVEVLQRRLASSLTRPVQERVLDVLQELAGLWRQPAAADARIHVPVTQDALASMVGATRESVNRAIRKLVAEGRVRRSGRSYELVGQTGGPGCS